MEDLTMRLSITSTTGGPLELTVPRGETVEGLRTRISQKLRLPRNRTILLHRDRQLTAGKLLELGVTDGSKLTLVPVIEAGLVFSTTRSKRTMMDVLESLPDNQISDFLSGHSPLTINLGIGAHVMYVQLQLSEQDVKKLQENGDLRIQRNTELQNSLSTAVGMSQADSGSMSFITSESPQKSSTPVLDSGVCPTAVHDNVERPLNPNAVSFSSIPRANNQQYSSLPQSSQFGHTQPSAYSQSSGPLQATAPISSSAPAGFSPGPPSPVEATTFEKSNVQTSPSTDQRRQTGAVIESFVNHSPGVFSGTFSGTLAPLSQTGVSHPRHGINIILQILSDLLRAACHHQVALSHALPEHHCPAVNSSLNPVLTEGGSGKTRSKPVVTQRAEHTGEEINSHRSLTEEEQTLHCKLERLQSLMHERRFRKRTQRSTHLPQMSHPYQRQQHL
ncbi:midnolin isoform X2 [Cynoglossus semilaevis]|uniref:midnolin isoform X2 n=1 Tax=Cynoglossus semilaevis TaxID=244447 RepID=UPI00049510AC|nr:midnolin isoform X2 [Cynoglossus semilaevis]